MPDTFNNIFLTTENLAFSLPLIIVCATYVSAVFLWMIRLNITLYINYIPCIGRHCRRSNQSRHLYDSVYMTIYFKQNWC